MQNVMMSNVDVSKQIILFYADLKTKLILWEMRYKSRKMYNVTSTYWTLQYLPIVFVVVHSKRKYQSNGIKNKTIYSSRGYTSSG